METPSKIQAIPPRRRDVAFRSGLVLGLLPLFMTLSACSDATGPGNGPGGEDKIVEGVNFTTLFTPPRSSEISSLYSEWQSRQTPALDVQVLETFPFLLGSANATAQVVSHRVGEVTHYGAIITPDEVEADNIPVLVYAHGGDNGVIINEVQLIAASLGELADQFVYVVPSFRSESLRVGSRTYTSTGDPSPWDRDVDDALSLLNVTLGHTSLADPERIGVLGFSRGATVGMLMAIRDIRVGTVVEFFGPTDFYDVSAQNLVEDILLDRYESAPGVDYIAENIVLPLQRGEITYEEARREMTRRSPAQFASALPALMIHHGTNDDVVSVSQAQSLIRYMEFLGRGLPDFSWYIYQGGRHDPFTLVGAVDRTINFLETWLLQGPPGAFSPVGGFESGYVPPGEPTWPNLTGQPDYRTFPWSWSRDRRDGGR
jgi:hypothetical protein